MYKNKVFEQRSELILHLYPNIWHVMHLLFSNILFHCNERAECYNRLSLVLSAVLGRGQFPDTEQHNSDKLSSPLFSCAHCVSVYPSSTSDNFHLVKVFLPLYRGTSKWFKSPLPSFSHLTLIQFLTLHHCSIHSSLVMHWNGLFLALLSVYLQKCVWKACGWVLCQEECTDLDNHCLEMCLR